MQSASVLSLLRERAGLQPDDVVFSFTDYDQEWAGVRETVTWAQLYQRTLNLAHEIRRHGEVGDRAVILAPQGLPYIVSFLGAMQAGFIAVPLSVPSPGAHDERVSAVLEDTSPAVVLTVSAIAQTVDDYVRNAGADAAPTILEVDKLDLDAENPRSIRLKDGPSTAYLQYTSGSTRLPAGVMITHRNLLVNFQQLMAYYFAPTNGIAPQDLTLVSWLPFYHDMGLVLGVVAPILGGWRGELMSPIAFLQRPARWVQALANSSSGFSASPNFAFDMASRKTTDADAEGLDFSRCHGIISGSERIHPATLNRFSTRFAPYNFGDHMMLPSYGLAEGTVFGTCRSKDGRAPVVVNFEPEKLAAGTAERTDEKSGSPLLSYGAPKSPLVKIVDSETRVECPAGTIGEIWMHGENVAEGYWNKPDETARTFGGVLADPSPDTPDSPWLRTGDLGFMSEGEMFIVGRVKDMLIVYGRNHYPEDIELTVSGITGGRVAAISVPVEQTEKLVTIIEVKKRGDSDDEVREKLDAVKNDVTAAISKSHGLTAADLVLVEPGAIPTTTSGKIRRAACVEQYRRQQFTRLDA
jgi:fatty acid CoA ligase FadD21